ncbi:MAG: DUF11 domain-containing protein, partial [Woeseiaceae bacterium]|nr:DUF11 domain-containing protein [Woeseiaceae bacterium]
MLSRSSWTLVILAFCLFAKTDAGITELQFAPEPVNLTPALGSTADKARLLRLTNGTLVVAWHEGAGPPDSAWGPVSAPFAARDIFVRASYDDGETWTAALNVSNTADLTDETVFYDSVGDGSGLGNFYGDSSKPTVIAAGTDLAVTWHDAYCGPGIQGPARYPTETGMLEVPYHCLYVARLKVGAGGISVVSVDRLSDASRDVKNEVIRASGAGFAAAWQEDPDGLQLGEARGEGDGASGARVSPGTDIWYAWITRKEFTDAAAAWHGPVPISDNYDYEASVATGGGGSRPNLFVAGSPPTAMLVYEEAKNNGKEDRGKYVRFHQFAYDAPPTGEAGIIVSAPAENARRARVIATTSPGRVYGTRMALMWRQGEGIQGAPADFMMRVGSVPEGTDLAATPDAGFRTADLRPAVDTADANNSAPALNLSSAALYDATAEDPNGNAKAHRAIMDGDFIYAGYTHDSDALDGVDAYQYFVRWTDDGGVNWSEPVQVSGGTDGVGNVIEPRLIRTPGTVDSGKPEDIRNPDVYVLAWGSALENPDGSEPVRDALYVTRTVDRGLSFEPVRAMADSRSADDQTDEQIQLRVSPDGQQLGVVWIRRDTTESDVIFTTALGITRTADLVVSLSPSNATPDVGAAIEVDIEVANGGPFTATELMLNVEVPDGLSLLDVDAGSGTCDVPARVECLLDDLAPGAAAVVTLSLVADTRGEWRLVAESAALEEEPEPADNRAELAIDVIAKADLSAIANP